MKPMIKMCIAHDSNLSPDGSCRFCMEFNENPLPLKREEYYIMRDETRAEGTNLRWARNVCNHNPCIAGSFVSAIGRAYLLADDENLKLLDEAVSKLRIKYPTWDCEEVAI